MKVSKDYKIRGIIALAQKQSPNNLLGIAWMLVHAIAHSGMLIIAKHLQSSLAVFQILFISYLAALTMLFMYIAVRGRSRLRKTALNYQIIRSILGVFAAASFLFSLNNLSLAAATSISYLIPISVSILGVLIFKEKLTKVKIACLIFGMLGVIIITRPDNQDFNGGSALVLLAVLLWSLASILLKKIGSKANNTSQLFFTYFFGVILLIPFVISNWHEVPNDAYIWLVLSGILSIIQLTALFRAFKCGELTAIMPFDYVRLPMNMLVGFALFQEAIDTNVIIGSSIIIIINLYFIMHNRRKVEYVE